MIDRFLGGPAMLLAAALVAATVRLVVVPDPSPRHPDGGITVPNLALRGHPIRDYPEAFLGSVKAEGVAVEEPSPIFEHLKSCGECRAAMRAAEAEARAYPRAKPARN